jgi:deoxyribose-phosphate aldolase
MENIHDILALAQQYLVELPPAAEIPQLPEGADIARYIDHTLLKPEATAEQIKKLCEEARQHSFASVCVNPCYVPLASGLLSGSNTVVCTVVGFPLGASLPIHKVVETLETLSMGAREIDMVINIGALKGQAYGLVLNEIQSVVQTAHNQRALVKVIIETALLTRQEKIIASLLVKAAGAEYVKTSTGFAAHGATIEDVELMYRVVGPKTKVKAAGGVRSLSDARAMIAAGASRLGASAGVQIIQEAVV